MVSAAHLIAALASQQATAARFEVFKCRTQRLDVNKLLASAKAVDGLWQPSTPFTLATQSIAAGQFEETADTEIVAGQLMYLPAVVFRNALFLYFDTSSLGVLHVGSSVTWSALGRTAPGTLTGQLKTDLCTALHRWQQACRKAKQSLALHVIALESTPAGAHFRTAALVSTWSHTLADASDAAASTWVPAESVNQSVGVAVSMTII